MKEHLLNLVDTSRKYTLDVAAAMPSGKYDTKPVDTVWNFKELLHHIAYGIEWWEANYVRKQETEWVPTPTGKDKKEVVKYLEKAYAGLEKSIKDLPLDEEAVRGVHSTLDHVTHHRGQAVLHLRVQGEEVPGYIY
ncbi:MAG: DinB family protein [Chitinophagaceae bacterium]|nr:DinB family protein [Chitinophagaceae bacterium]